MDQLAARLIGDPGIYQGDAVTEVPAYLLFGLDVFFAKEPKWVRRDSDRDAWFISFDPNLMPPDSTEAVESTVCLRIVHNTVDKTASTEIPLDVAKQMYEDLGHAIHLVEKRNRLLGE